MTWFKTDDKFRDHRKVRKLGKDKLPAVGLWNLCGNWSADNLTDGFVPHELVESLDPKHRYAKRLVEVGLWVTAAESDEDGYRFHDWEDHQPTRADVEKRRTENRERVKRWREAKQGTKDASNDVSNGARNGLPTPLVTVPPSRPVPSRPVPTRSLSGSVGEGRSSSERANGQTATLPTTSTRSDTRPADRCDTHVHDESPPPCGRCAEARKRAERWDDTAADRALSARLEARGCQWCDADGWRIDPQNKHRGPLSPGVRCDHTAMTRAEFDEYAEEHAR